MTDKLEMPLEQFAEAVAKENARLNNRIEKLEAALRKLSCTCVSNYDCERGDFCPSWIARKGLEGKDE